VARIALFYPWRPGNAQEFLRGIFRYARPARPWEFSLTFDQDIRKITAWKPDGVIGHFFSESAVAVVRTLGVPAVDTALDIAATKLPQVGLDDRAIGVLAAEYLLDRGFRHLAFLGDERKEFSRRTAAGFTARLRQADRDVIGVPSRWFSAPVDAVMPPPREAVTWLRERPAPLAVFTAGDHLALPLLEAGRLAGRRIPEDLAVLGAGNVELICSMAYPPLSSVRVAAEAAGYEAARLLDRLMDGAPAPPARIEFPPLGVVTRRSTDVLAVTDAALASALRFIRDQARRPIGVTDVARAACLSRSTLERRFGNLVGRTPAAEIRRVRVERARQLLIETDWLMARVAEESGLGEGGRLSDVFRAETGETPTAYRRRFRLAGWRAGPAPKRGGRG